jgi:hypothetical protein
MVIRLAHFHLRHPIEDFAWIEVAKDSAFELQKQGRVKRVTEIEQRIRAGQPLPQSGFGEAETARLTQIVGIARSALVQQAVIFGQSVNAQLCGEASDCSQVRDFIPGAGENFEPDGLKPKSP